MGAAGVGVGWLAGWLSGWLLGCMDWTGRLDGLAAGRLGVGFGGMRWVAEMVKDGSTLAGLGGLARLDDWANG